ncbi:uncharacterized protein [Nothobranchius furzeri]|uniref:uncharacterized protein n=1 Tax=Nothobranchius furzeri TaxID=105023 RepID=UPI00390491AA
MDTMDKAFVFKDLKSFECSSPSELDRKFFGEQGLLSALSLEYLSLSRASNEAVANRSEGRVSILASLCLSTDLLSPCRGFSFLGSGSNTQEADGCTLTVPMQGKFSTPIVTVPNSKPAGFFDRSNGDLTSLQISWDVSVIKAESNSPRCFVDSSVQQQTWSPKPQNQSLAEVSP